MALNYENLFNNCVQILNAYNPSYSIDYNFEEYVKYTRVENERLLYEVLSGCNDNAQALNIFMSDYYKRDGRNSLKADENIFKFVLYLVIYRSDDIGLKYLKKFVKYIDINKIIRFLKFITNLDYLHTWIKDDLYESYDAAYVDDKLLKPILKALPDLQVILKDLEDILDTTNRVQTAPQVTNPQPFDLTQPKPVKILLPKKIVSDVRIRDVPNTTYDPPEEFKRIADISMANRKRAMELLDESKQNQPKCATKQNNNSMVSFADQSSTKQFQATPLKKKILNGEIPVKLNTATVLREGNLYKKQTDAVISKFQNLERGDGDATKFIRWQEEMKQSDNEKRLVEIERRKIESKLIYEQAILAKTKLTEDNKRRAEYKKKETKELIDKLMEQKEYEDLEQKQTVERIRKDHENVKVEQAKMQNEKKKIVEELNRISEENEAAAVRQIEEDMKKKMELIQKIKALESIPSMKKDFIDLSQTAGHNLLSEMSIIELKERLQILRDKQQLELENRHDNIIKDKIEKDQTLVETLTFIHRYKTEMKKKPEKKESSLDSQVRSNSDLKKLNDKLANLRGERHKTKASDRVTNKILESSHQALHLLYVNQRKQLEINRLSDIESTQERLAKAELIM